MSDRAEILELYRIFVETITANEQRRQSLVAVYMSLIAAGGAILGSKVTLDPLWIASAIAIVSMTWLLTMRYFRRLARAKFSVITEMESHFDFRPFEMEWNYFNNRPSRHGGTSPRWLSRWTLTHFDQVIPAITLLCSCGYLLRRALG